jgi:hypothetical protein
MTKFLEGGLYARVGLVPGCWLLASVPSPPWSAEVGVEVVVPPLPVEVAVFLPAVVP